MGAVNSATQEPALLVGREKPYFTAINACFQLLPILFLAVRLIHIWTQTPPNLTAQFDDDAFYYLKVAQNIVHHHHVSFDQTTTTNGLHPLWLGLLLPVSYLTDDRLLLLRLVASLSTALLAAAYYLAIRHLVRNYHIFTVALVICAMQYWIVKEYAYGHMESSILLPLCVACVSRLPSLILKPTGSSATWAGLLFALVFLARLDAAFLVMSLFLVTLVAIYRGADVTNLELAKMAILMAAPVFVLGPMFVGANYFVFGHPVPVSGYVKSLNSLATGSFNWVLLAQLGTRDWLPFCGTTIFTIAYLIAILSSRSLRVSLAHRNQGLFAISIGIALFNVVFILYYMFCTSWAMWFWYTYPAFLSTIFVIPLVIDRLVLNVLNVVKGSLVYSGLRIALIGMTVLAVAYSGKDLLKPNRDRSDSFKYENYLLAQEMNKRFPAKPLIAMGDRAGSFAYWYDGNVLQIEGVIADYEIADAIQRNDLSNYLTKHGVHILLHWTYDYGANPAKQSGGGPNFLKKLWSPRTDFAPARNYVQWKLVTPWPFLSTGPYASLRLHKRDELLKFPHKEGFIYAWKWKGAEPRLESEGQ